MLNLSRSRNSIRRSRIGPAPIAAAGEIVVGDEEARDALRGVGACTMASTSSGVRQRDGGPASPMMVQKLQVERAAAAGVKVSLGRPATRVTTSHGRIG